MISDGDYGPYFTHRLGHGLGLEMHEHPYLNGANDEVLKAGAVVTNEPVRLSFLSHQPNRRSSWIKCLPYLGNLHHRCASEEQGVEQRIRDTA